MPNDIHIGSLEHPITENLSTVTVGGERTSLEIASIGNGARVNGDLKVSGNILGNIQYTDIVLDDLTCDDIICDTINTRAGAAGHKIGELTFTAGDTGTDQVITGSDGIRFTGSAFRIYDIGPEEQVRIINESSETRLFIFDATNDVTTDHFLIGVGASGATTITTVDGDAAIAHLNIEADGHVEFDGCGVGFEKVQVTFSDDSLIDGAGDSTNVDFRTGNKQELILTDDIAGSDEDLIMIFPATSGNFILTISQDAGGGNAVAADAWRAYASDLSEADNTLASDGTDGEVRWAGGSAPTLSTGANAVDVISIYWDADNQTALAVASLAFATP